MFWSNQVEFSIDYRGENQKRKIDICLTKRLTKEEMQNYLSETIGQEIIVEQIKYEKRD